MNFIHKIVNFVKRILAWGESVVKDPLSGDASSSRIAGIVCITVGCLVALIAVLAHKENMATAGIVGALTGGGAGSIAARTKAEAPSEPKG